MQDSRSKKTKLERARRARAHRRIRNRVQGSSTRPRLAVFKSSRFIYAQVIDDQQGVTLAQASSREADLLSDAKGSASTVEAAKSVGEAIAARAMEKGVEAVVFDRGGFVYHGKVKALADGARSKGLEF